MSISTSHMMAWRSKCDIFYHVTCRVRVNQRFAVSMILFHSSDTLSAGAQGVSSLLVSSSLPVTHRYSILRNARAVPAIRQLLFCPVDPSVRRLGSFEDSLSDSSGEESLDLVLFAFNRETFGLQGLEYLSESLAVGVFEETLTN